MSEVTGVIYKVGETKEYGSNGFKKREFVIVLTGEHQNPEYPNHVAFELIKDKCSKMDGKCIGDEIKVGYNLTGRLWVSDSGEEKCFNALQAWKIDDVSSGSQAGSVPQNVAQPEIDNSDIPF